MIARAAVLMVLADGRSKPVRYSIFTRGKRIKKSLKVYIKPDGHSINSPQALIVICYMRLSHQTLFDIEGNVLGKNFQLTWIMTFSTGVWRTVLR